MNDITQRKIKTGGDPRTLSDYAALRDELSKLTHPARPDVNWHYVEKLCLSLFEQNGVELQTVAWYTLARTQLTGLFGLNEGLAILEALISHQWGALWPQPVHARMEILSSLSQRLHQLMRMIPLNYSDLSQLYHAEQKLTRLGEVLQRLELKHLSQLDTLRTLLHNSAVRLENSDDTTCSGLKNQSGIVSPASVTNAAAASTRELTDGSPEDIQTPGGTVKWVYVAQPELQPNVDVLATVPTPVKQWKSFTAGMCTMLLISAAALWSWHLIQRPSPLRVQLAASLAPLPAVLAPDKLAQLRQQSPLPEELLTQTQQQLARLDELPADWNIDYSRMLIEQARVLWPEQATSMALHWQQQLNAAAIPTDRLNGWHEGMTTLQKLSDRLNGLDEKKGKYMTVSELKSVVFSSMQSFNRSIPAEEQLRELSANPAVLPLPVTARVQLEMHLKQLIARYAAIKQTAKE